MGNDIDKIYKHILKYGWHAISQLTHINQETGKRTVIIDLAYFKKLLSTRRYYLQPEEPNEILTK